MRLIKRELAAKLNVSEKSLTAWQKEGMPVLEHGRRGQPSTYDLAAVLRWVRQTRDPLRLAHVPLDELEREAGLAPLPAPPAVHTSALAIEDDEALRAHPGVEMALIRLPAILRGAGLGEVEVDQALEDLFTAFEEELRARGEPEEFITRESSSLRSMIDEERRNPGAWTE